KRVADSSRAQLVAIGLRPCAETGVEVRGRLDDIEHPDVLWQLRIERAHERLDGMRAVDRDARHLAERVNAGIRAAGAVNRHGCALELRERVLEKTLNRFALRLALPADEPRAVVGDRELKYASQASPPACPPR